MRKKNKWFGYNTIEEKIFDMVRKTDPRELSYFLLMNFLFEPNDKGTRDKIQKLLSEIYEGIYLVRCSEKENPPDTSNLTVLFVGLNETFTISIGASDSIKKKQEKNDSI